MITYQPTCPDCGGAMRLRTNKNTGEQFYGCSFYPECTGTLPYDGRHPPADDMPSDRLRENDRQRWRRE